MKLKWSYSVMSKEATSTLTTDEIKKLLEYFSTVPLSKFAQFNGKQWMRQAGKGKGARQDTPEARPIFRD